MKTTTRWGQIQCGMAIMAIMMALFAMTVTSRTAAAMNECQQQYVVQRGDTLARLAQRFGKTIGDLQALNAIHNTNRIYVGQRLCIQRNTVGPDASATNVKAIEVVANMNVRRGPGLHHAVVSWLASGATASVTGLSHDGQWWRIACAASTQSSCWVSAHGRYTRPIAANHPPQQPDQIHDQRQPTDVTAVVVMTDEATLYAGPGERYEIVGFMFGGMPIPINGMSADGRWWHAHCPDAPNPAACNYWISADARVTQPTALP